jgi:hypothetical protein
VNVRIAVWVASVTTHVRNVKAVMKKLKRIFVNNVNVVTDVVIVPSVQIANVRTLIGCAIVVQNTVIYATALRMLQLVPVMFVTLVQVV